MPGGTAATDRNPNDLAWSYSPALLAAALPVAALGYANLFGGLAALTYVHIGVGTVWTGAVVCIGFGLAPVLDGRDAAGRCAILARLTPLTVVLLPSLAAVTVAAGVELALAYDSLALSSPLMLAVFAVTALIAVVAFGLVLPNDVRLYRELRAETPDADRIGSLGARNAKLLTVQGAFQIAMLFLMVGVSGQVPS